MTQVSIEVKGFEALFKRMDELRDEIGKGKTDRIWRNVMEYAFEPVLEDAKTFAPENTGQLRNHIYMKAHKPQMFDKASKYYQGEMYMVRVTSSPIRDDSVLHTILNKRGRFQTVWRGKKPVGVSQEYGNKRVPKYQGQGFIRPALIYNMEKVYTRLGQALIAQIEKIGEGKQ